MCAWTDTHCSECGNELGRVNIRETSTGTKRMCCYCADKYDNTDWSKIAKKQERIRKLMQESRRMKGE